MSTRALDPADGEPSTRAERRRQTEIAARRAKGDRAKPAVPRQVTRRGKPDRDRPRYARALRLHHIYPGELVCFLLFEGVIGLAVLMSLAELVSWTSVLIVPLVVAGLTKVHDIIAGMFSRPGVRPRRVVRPPKARGVAKVRGVASVRPVEAEREASRLAVPTARSAAHTGDDSGWADEDGWSHHGVTDGESADPAAQAHRRVNQRRFTASIPLRRVEPPATG